MAQDDDPKGLREDDPPSFMEGVDRAASGTPSLGDPQVVYGLVQRMAKASLDAPEKAGKAVRAAARIFVGRDPGYAPMGEWNTGDGLARWCRSHINGLKAYPEPEAVIIDALAHLVLQLWATARSSAADDAKRVRTEALLQNWACLMVGIEPEGAVPRLPEHEDGAEG